MARKPLRPLIRGGGFYPSRKWTPLVYAGGYTTANGGGEPEPPPIEKTITGNPIHITDALAKPVQALSVKLEPIQDLNGYDNPWPAGGGKNKVDYLSCVGVGTRDDTDSVEESVSVSSGVVTLTGYASYNSGGHIFKGIGSPSITGAFTVSADVKCTAGTVAFGVGAYEGGGTSDVATNYDVTANTWTHISRTFTDKTYAKVGIFLQPKLGTDVLEVKNLQLELGSTATSYAPYSNICPISGHTDADVTRTGKNLFDKSKAKLYSNVARFIKYGVESYSDTLPNGDCVLDVGTYTLSISGDGTETPASMAAYDSSGNRLAIIYNNKILTFTTTSAGACYLSINFVDAVTWEDYNIQLELNNSATDFSPYVGTTYPIPLGTTVYGGTLDVLTGVLTVDKVFVELDGSSDEVWYWHSSGVAYAAVSGGIITDATTQFEKLTLCDKLQSASWAGRGISDNSCGMLYGASYIFIKVSNSITDAATARTWLSNNPITVVYPLATPQTIQLTAQQVELLLGENNIWSDGEMTLVYLADGNASDVEALNILLANRYVNNHTADDVSDREALNILLGGQR